MLELDEAMVKRQQARFPQVHHARSWRAGRLQQGGGRRRPCCSITRWTPCSPPLRVPPGCRHRPVGGLWPDALFARGVTLLRGTRVTDGAAFTDAMARGESWSAASRKFAIGRDLWPGWERLLA